MHRVGPVVRTAAAIATAAATGFVAVQTGPVLDCRVRFDAEAPSRIDHSVRVSVINAGLGPAFVTDMWLVSKDAHGTHVHRSWEEAIQLEPAEPFRLGGVSNTLLQPHTSPRSVAAQQAMPVANIFPRRPASGGDPPPSWEDDLTRRLAARNLEVHMRYHVGGKGLPWSLFSCEAVAPLFKVPPPAPPTSAPVPVATSAPTKPTTRRP